MILMNEKLPEKIKDIPCYELNDFIDVLHLDGSLLCLNNASLIENEDGIRMNIITEHLGNMEIFKEDCKIIKVNSKVIYKEKLYEN